MSNDYKMKLYLVEMPASVLGIYGANKDRLAARMRFLHPDAAASYMQMENARRVICSDMYRSADSSLHAVQAHRGAQWPAYSAHNFGLAIDLDVSGTKKLNGFKTKLELDEYMMSNGWYCHVPPGYNRSSESWHYNYLGPNPGKYLAKRTKRIRTWSHVAEARISDVYSFNWKSMSVEEVQTHLKGLKIYSGAIDGKVGPLYDQAVKAFQRAWLLDVDGVVGPRTRRTLKFVCA